MTLQEELRAVAAGRIAVYAHTATDLLTRAVDALDAAERDAERWKQVAENAACAATKAEACAIVEAAIAAGRK